MTEPGMIENNRGARFQNGTGAEPPDLCKAMQCYIAAVNLGNGLAMYNLASLYRTGGKGVPKNAQMAKQLYEKAIDKGDKDTIKGAMYNLAVIFRYGDEGIAKDVNRAKKLFEQGCNMGDTDAMNGLAVLLQYGDEGIPKDVLRAKELYEQAAGAKDMYAMFNLGTLYRYGDVGILKDLRRARKWYEDSIVNGHNSVKKYLEDMFRNCTSEERMFLMIENEKVLDTAFCYGISKPEVLGADYLRKYIQPEFITNSSNLIAGHNLILLSIRNGSVDMEKLKSLDNSPWYFQNNLYHPASRVVSIDSNVLESILQHAKKIGLIKNSYIFKIGHCPLRKDIQETLEEVGCILSIFSQRLNFIEETVSQLHSKVSQYDVNILFNNFLNLNRQAIMDSTLKLSRDLTDFQTLIRKKEFHVLCAGIARCTLSLVHYIRNALGHATEAGVDYFFGMFEKDMFSDGNTAVKEVNIQPAYVDLSNLTVIRSMFSEHSIRNLDKIPRDVMMSAIHLSGFQNIGNLRLTLKAEIEYEIRDEVISVYLPDDDNNVSLQSTGSKYSSNEPFHPKDESDDLNEHRQLALKCFRVISKKNKDGIVSTEDAHEETNRLLGLQKHSPISYEHFEKFFFSVAGEDEIDVCESSFMKTYQTIHGRAQTCSRLILACKSHFQRYSKKTNTMTFEKAAKALRLCLKQCRQDGVLKSVTSENIDINYVKQILIRFDLDKEGVITEDEFVKAGMLVVGIQPIERLPSNKGCCIS